MSRLAGSRSGRWATAIWGGFACGAGAGFSGFVPPVAAGALLLAAVGLVAWSALARWRRRLWLLALVLAAVLVGSARGASSVEQPGPGRIDGHLGSRPVTVLGTVREAPPGPGPAVTIDVSRVSDADTDRSVTGGLLVSGRNVPTLDPGDQVEVDTGGLRPPDRRPGPESEARPSRSRRSYRSQSTGACRPTALWRGRRRGLSAQWTRCCPSHRPRSCWASRSASISRSPARCARHFRMPGSSTSWS